MVNTASAPAPAAEGQPAAIERLRQLRDHFESRLLAARPDVHIVSQAVPRIANTSCLRFGTLPAEWVLQRLDEAGLYASSGAACQSGGTQPSHVQLALGASPTEALACLRFSLSRDNTLDEMDRAVALILQAVQHAETLAQPAA
jgi:cysteine desulfurase